MMGAILEDGVLLAVQLQAEDTRALLDEVSKQSLLKPHTQATYMLHRILSARTQEGAEQRVNVVHSTNGAA